MRISWRCEISASTDRNNRTSTAAQPEFTRNRRQAVCALSSCSKRHWNRRLPSLAGSRLPLPKRFYCGLVEVRISGRCDDSNIRNVPLRHQKLNGNGRSPTAQAELGLAEMTAQAQRAIAALASRAVSGSFRAFAPTVPEYRP